MNFNETATYFDHSLMETSARRSGRVGIWGQRLRNRWTARCATAGLQAARCDWVLCI